MDLLNLIILGMAVGSVSITLTRTYVFRTPRNWLRRQGEWFDKLATCPYCVSHYVAVFFLVVTGYRVSVPGPSLLVTLFAVVAGSSFTVGLIFKSLQALGPPAPLPEEEEDE